MSITFGKEVNPGDAKMTRAGVDRIVTLFEKQFADQLHPGAQLVVLRHGKVIIDRSVGVIQEGGHQSVVPETPFLTFSCTKPLTSFCIHQLVESGKLEFEAPIAEYWPEFGQGGKETATIRHVLLHQAGVPTKWTYSQIPYWWHWERVTRFVAKLSTEFEPGTRTAYHPINYGFILGEVMRRVDGRTVEQFMREELFEPLGMQNAFLGLPRSESSRAAEVYWGTPDQRNVVLLFRQARYAVMPAASLNCSARDLAIFYQMLVNDGEYAGRRYLSKEMLDVMTTPYFAGVDETLGSFVRWGHGIGVGGRKPVRI